MISEGKSAFSFLHLGVEPEPLPAQPLRRAPPMVLTHRLWKMADSRTKKGSLAGGSGIHMRAAETGRSVSQNIYPRKNSALKSPPPGLWWTGSEGKFQFDKRMKHWDTCVCWGEGVKWESRMRERERVRVSCERSKGGRDLNQQAGKLSNLFLLPVFFFFSKPGMSFSETVVI